MPAQTIGIHQYMPVPDGETTVGETIISYPAVKAGADASLWDRTIGVFKTLFAASPIGINAQITRRTAQVAAGVEPDPVQIGNPGASVGKSTYGLLLLLVGVAGFIYYKRKG